jgi:hypothetical protein
LIQTGPSLAQKNELKYGHEGLKEGNYVLHRNFYRFKMDFKWKSREALGLNLKRIWWNFFLESSNWDETSRRDL